MSVNLKPFRAVLKPSLMVFMNAAERESDEKVFRAIVENYKTLVIGQKDYPLEGGCPEFDLLHRNFCNAVGFKEKADLPMAIMFLRHLAKNATIYADQLENHVAEQLKEAK